MKWIAFLSPAAREQGAANDTNTSSIPTPLNESVSTPGLPIPRAFQGVHVDVFHSQFVTVDAQ